MIRERMKGGRKEAVEMIEKMEGGWREKEVEG